jgi:UDP-N-acetylglucosamine/UDP-N-acetylgalactosamine diphosphorylase
MCIRFHIAKKKIPYADESGKKTDATKENGWKMEMFIFDVFQCSKKMVALECNREEEFSPLKNGPGAPKDSPETCLADVCRLYAKCIFFWFFVFICSF